MPSATPIACTLGAEDRAARQTTARELGERALVAVHVSERRARLRFRGEHERVDALVADERACCALSARASAGLAVPSWKVVYKRADDRGLNVLRSAGERASVLVRHPVGLRDLDHPVWSPDGRMVAYTQAGEGLFVTQRGTSRRIAPGAVIREIVWSPDGRYVAFGRDGRPGAGIYVVARQGGRPARLLASVTRDGCTSFGPTVSWSPDSSQLVVWCDGEIIKMRRGGSDRRRLNAPLGGVVDGLVSPASWSPDGRLIAYRRHCTEAHSDVFCDIAVMNPDGDEKRTLVRRDRRSVAGPAGHMPVWGSDGCLLVDEWGFRHRVLSVDPNSAAKPRLLYPVAAEPIPGPDGSFAIWTGSGNRAVLNIIGRDGTRLLRRVLPPYVGGDASLWLG